MKITRTPRIRRAAAVAVATASLMAFGLGAASAHVGVTPESTTAGGYTELTFSVPNESETAGTNKVKVELPTETPFTSVRAKPVPGWTAEVITSELPEPVEAQGTTVTKAPASVVWTADDKGILPEQYQTFSISVGTLPEAGTTVMLPTAQFYTDGSVSAWGETEAASGEEPAGEAPSFTTTAEGAADEQESAPAATETESPEVVEAAVVDTTGQTLGWIGLGAGVLGLIVGLVALGRTRGIGRN